MRCEEVRKTLLEGWSQELEEPARTHLSTCTECRLYARDLGLLRGGFQALAQEPVPEPSWGFSQRLLRRLEEGADAQNVAEEFFERVGRRVVYVAGMLALVLLLVLGVAPSGPLQTASAGELYSAQAEAVETGNNSLFTDEPAEVFSTEAGISENGGAEQKK